MVPMSVPSASLLGGFCPGYPMGWGDSDQQLQTHVPLISKPVKGELLFPRSSNKSSRVEAYWLISDHVTISDQLLKGGGANVLTGWTGSVLDGGGAVCAVGGGDNWPEIGRGREPQRENLGASL